MQTLLNIDDYRVDHIEISTNSDYKKSDVATVPFDINFDIKRNKDNPLAFLIPMSIQFNANGGISPSIEYHINLAITGYFSFLEGTSEEAVNKMIAPNGLSILYGVARGVVAQVTGNCKYGKYILPTLNFMEIIENKFKKLNSEKAPTPSKKKTSVPQKNKKAA